MGLAGSAAGAGEPPPNAMCPAREGALHAEGRPPRPPCAAERATGFGAVPSERPLSVAEGARPDAHRRVRAAVRDPPAELIPQLIADVPTTGSPSFPLLAEVDWLERGVSAYGVRPRQIVGAVPPPGFHRDHPARRRAAGAERRHQRLHALDPPARRREGDRSRRQAVVGHGAAEEWGANGPRDLNGRARRGAVDHGRLPRFWPGAGAAGRAAAGAGGLGGRDEDDDARHRRCFGSVAAPRRPDRRRYAAPAGRLRCGGGAQLAGVTTSVPSWPGWIVQA